MYKLWESGDHIVHRGIVNGQVRVAKSMTVVCDTKEETILVLVPQAPCQFPSDLIERKYSPSEKVAQSRWDVQERGSWQMVDWLWKSQRILIFMKPLLYYAVYLRWEHETDKFLGWYVNFESPFVRSPLGFDTLDLELDLLIQPDGSYNWKDMADYHEGVRRGAINEDMAKEIEVAREQVMQHIRDRRSPFDDTWIDWKPDPTWSIPRLHPDWNRIW